MATRFRPRAFISLPDNQEKLSHQDIKKGLENTDLNVKEKNLRLLIMYILNSENFPQMVMDVINNIVPIQNKSRGLKKLLFLYWEVIEKFKPDGSLKDEILLVCNNFRNDLLHPNEYMVGRALRMIANSQSKTIIEKLIEVILDKCLSHTELYVRRYTMACLVQIHEYYGNDVLPDLTEKLKSTFTSENDLTTKRNILLYLFRVDKEEFLKLVLEAIHNEEHESFGDIVQFIIIKLSQEAMVSDRKLTSTCLKIIREFAHSKFNSVLFEVATSLIRFTQSSELLAQAVGILTQILKNNSDNNVKLIILEQLDIVRKKDKLVVMDSFSDLFTMVFSGDMEIKLKFLPFMKEYIRKENINAIQKTDRKSVV